jgi:hypothetical protein
MTVAFDRESTGMDLHTGAVDDELDAERRIARRLITVIMRPFRLSLAARLV